MSLGRCCHLSGSQGWERRKLKQQKEDERQAAKKSEKESREKKD
jgi:hypothetical protein